MRLGRVVGEVVSTVKIPSICCHKLLHIQYVDELGGSRGAPVIALDTVGAGIGEDVLVVDEGNACSQILGEKQAPVRTMVVGVVDRVDLG